MSDDCVSCSKLPPCDCRDDQICVLVGRSCDSCGENTCQDDPDAKQDSSDSNGGGGGGGTNPAGPAVGGVLAAIVLGIAVWFFWRRRKRQQAAAANKSNSALARSGSTHEKSTSGSASGLKVRFGQDAKNNSAPAPRRSNTNHPNRMSRGLAMSIEEKGLPNEDHPGLGEHTPTAAAPSQMLLAVPDGQERSRSPSPVQPQLQHQTLNLGDPFSDEHRSIHSQSPGPAAESYSARQSQQMVSQASPVLPQLAHVPPHANSMSVTDGLERDALGSRRTSQVNINNSNNRSSSSAQSTPSPVPEVRLSLGPLPQPDAETMIGNLASQTSPASPSGGSTNGQLTPSGSTRSAKPPKPARPTREGLDLKLPAISAPSSSSPSSPNSFGVSSPPGSPGFPWNSSTANTNTAQSSLSLPPPPPINSAAGSRFSGSTTADAQNSYMTMDDRYSLMPPSSRPPSSGTSHMSNMSYILNPPQIVTATSTSRVAFAGNAVAKTMHLGSSPNTPNSAAVEALNSPAPPAAAPVPQTSELDAPRPSTSTADKRTTLSTMASADDPFADEVSAVIGQFPNPLATPTFRGLNPPNTPSTIHSTQAAQQQQRRSPLRQGSLNSDDDEDGDTDEYHHRSSRANTPVSVAMSTGPFDPDGDTASLRSRPNTMASQHGRPVSKDSLMDSMPFKPMMPQPSTSVSHQTLPRAADSSNSVPSMQQPTHNINSNQNIHATPTLGSLANDPDAPLPEPMRPFGGGGAGASPSSTDRQSTTSSLGALEGIPFNLGFHSADRGSMWSDTSDAAGLRNSAYSSTGGPFSLPSDVPPVPAVDPATLSPVAHRHQQSQQLGRPRSGDSSAERLQTPQVQNPSFESQQQQPQQVKTEVSGNRTSTDSFMQAAMLAQQLEHQP